MSSYDDPRWYEEPGIDQRHRLVPDDESKPTSATNANNSTQQQVSTQEPAPGKGPQLGRVFGQIVVTTTLMMIAFLGGWFGHQAFTRVATMIHAGMKSPG